MQLPRAIVSCAYDPKMLASDAETVLAFFESLIDLSVLFADSEKFTLGKLQAEAKEALRREWTKTGMKAISDGHRDETPVRIDFAELGVSRQTNAEEIENSYRRFTQRWNPERYAGLEPELSTFAKERLDNIESAYKFLQYVYEG